VVMLVYLDEDYERRKCEGGISVCGLR
jgi:hypothetical protein